MDNNEISYSLTIKMPGFHRYPSETDENFERRLKEEGKKRARYYLSGYLFDPDHKTIFEKGEFKRVNNE